MFLLCRPFLRLLCSSVFCLWRWEGGGALGKKNPSTALDLSTTGPAIFLLLPQHFPNNITFQGMRSGDHYTQSWSGIFRWVMWTNIDRWYISTWTTWLCSLASRGLRGHMQLYCHLCKLKMISHWKWCILYKKVHSWSYFPLHTQARAFTSLSIISSHFCVPCATVKQDSCFQVVVNYGEYMLNELAQFTLSHFFVKTPHAKQCTKRFFSSTRLLWS